MSVVRDEIVELIRREGPITFDRFQALCLYSKAGFYSSRTGPIGSTFRTAPTTHPVFGAMIARQLEEMWRLMDQPRVFHVIEGGSGDGALARAVEHTAATQFPEFARALCYVASDYAPIWPESPIYLDESAPLPTTPRAVQRVRAQGVDPFRGVRGCILSNELIDNFPVHRFQVRDGSLREVFVGVGEDGFVEVLAEPSTPRIEERLRGVAAGLREGQRGEVSLAIDAWMDRVAAVIERGFVLTIDYGQRADDLYSAANAAGTLRCFHDHAFSEDPYVQAGKQDITADVDFTALTVAGERRGLITVGYSTQRAFLERLGFEALLDEVASSGLSDARVSLRQQAMMGLVDEGQMGNFKVLVQSTGMPPDTQLTGFAR